MSSSITDVMVKPFVAAMVGGVISAGSMMISFHTDMEVMKATMQSKNKQIELLAVQVSELRKELSYIYGRNSGNPMQ